MLKKLPVVFILLLAMALLAGCSSSQPATKKVIKVGSTSGPQAQLLEAAKPVLAKDGVEMQIVEFSDYIKPNEALNFGELDANSYQHKPFLDAQLKKETKFDLVAIGNTVIMPMGLYSKKIKKLEDLPEGAIATIPNDPSNGGRALLLMQKFGLIKLKPEAGILPSPLDITENPKKLKIVEVEAAQSPRALDDATIVAVNTSYALKANLTPTKDAIALEDKDSPYTCVIVARRKDKDREELKKLVKAYQSPEVEQFIEKSFKDSVIKGW
ncbi:MAG: MetQ/NlpA family ABC transporter substrate-binding protein [Acidaminococcales bacterium]|jgi:D-methionine transport system substrate-binding protein|nr:MetQ/NlpA family ABC transporter substrate-binding protein [Acidaminococcales bacterium]